jgi:hypothetical protein
VVRSSALDIAVRHRGAWNAVNFTTAAVLLAEDLDTDVPINRYPTNSAFLPVTRQPRETSPSISARHCSD